MGHKKLGASRQLPEFLGCSGEGFPRKNSKGMGSNPAFSGLWRSTPATPPHSDCVPQIQTLFYFFCNFFFFFFCNLFQINWVVREAIYAGEVRLFCALLPVIFAPHSPLNCLPTFVFVEHSNREIADICG